MNDGIRMIVASYVSLGKVDALIDMKRHRENILQSIKTDPVYALPRDACLSDIDEIDKGLMEALNRTPFHGHVDRIDEERISGWAQFKDYPDIPVSLSIYRDGQLVRTLIADQFRADLRDQGFGSGNHGFSLVSNHALFDGASLIEVQTSDGRVLHKGSWTRPS